MSVKYYNPETAQWEMLASNNASGIKLLDAEGVVGTLPSYDENGNPVTDADGNEIEIRPTNVEDGMKALGRRMTKMEANFQDHLTNHPSGSGGGGGGGGIMPTINVISPEVISTTTDEDVIFEFQFSSPNIGIAQAFLEISGTENRAYQMTLKRQGNFTGMSGWNLGKFPMGTYSLSMYIVDAGGMYATMNTTCVIRSGSLTLTTDFIDSVDYYVSSPILYPYHIQSIADDPITIHYQIDSNPEQTIENVQNGSYGEINMGTIAVTGSHVIKVWATSTNMTSNILKHSILIVDAKGMYLTVNLDKTEFNEGEAISLYYRASKQNETYATAIFYINGVQTGTSTVATGANNLWNLGKNLDAGSYALQIKVRTLDTTDATENMETNTAIWSQTIEVKAGEFASRKPIIDGSELFIFDASGLSGEGLVENGEHVWKDKGRNNIKCTLHDFNYTAAEGGNGWNGDALVFSGKSYAVIDCAPFNNATNTGILANGFTLEICFAALDVGNAEARVLSCKNHLAPYQGIDVTPYVGTLKSQDGINMTTSYMDSINGEKFTTLTFSIKHGSKGCMCYIYVNGVLTRLEPCITNIFKYDGKIYLGAGLLSNGKVGNFANCKIKSVRAYTRQLAEDSVTMHDEVLDNFISDLDIEEQIYVWNVNYGTDTMPVLDINHPNFFKMVVGESYNCGIKYNDPTTGLGFDLTDSQGGDANSAGACPVSIQGTSSANYPVKNYTIELMQGGTNFNFAPRENWKPMSRFTLKANYMDSSQANNVAIARFYNDLTKAYNPLPTQAIDEDARSSIDGFPIRLRVNGMFAGIYTFNIDRYGHDVYGFSDTRQDIAYEIANNSDQFDVAGTSNDIRTRISTGFKYRYHYSDKGLVTSQLTASESGPLNMASGLHEDLVQLILWTGSSDGTEFKGNFSKHWSLNNMIDYHLLTLAWGMVDSYMKNMVIASYGTSDDGEGNRTRIWYPLMYDGDTSLGMNNQGQLVETPGCDTIWNGIEIGNYDGYHSTLWEKFTELFADEIAERYSQLRREGWFTVDKMMEYVYDDVIAKVGQKFYNEDMKYKYQEDNEKLQKRDFCRGTREEYTRRWIFERLSYLDTRFQVGEEAETTAVVRSNVVNELTLTIETYHPQWVRVKFMDGTTPVIKRLAANTPTVFRSSECPDIPNGIVTNPVNNNITIYCVAHIKNIDGLVDLKPSEIMIQSAKRLTGLDVHGTKNLVVLDVLNNTNLQTLNVKDCTKLGWDSASDKFAGGLDLRNCINLRYCDISNTGLTGLQLPQNSGSLEYFDASTTNIDAIEMVGQPYIEELKMTNCFQLGSVKASNCARLLKLNLANTTISKLDITLCPVINEINISGTSNLNNLSLNACQTLKILNMEGFKSPNYNILNLSTCPNIEELYLSGTTNLAKITFAEGATKLKVLDISNSSIATARFGQNVDFPNYFDLAQFNLTSVKFTNNNLIEHIKNIDYTGNGSSTFSNCKNLHTIECKPGGKLKLTGALNQTFYSCNKLTGIPSEIDLSASTSSSEAFAGCSKITMAQAKMIMDSVKNTGLNSGEHWRFFSGCSGITGQLPDDFFANAQSLSGMHHFFTGCKLTGNLPTNLLQPMKNSLTSTQYAFTGQTGLTGGIPSTFFHNLTKVTVINNMFEGCSNMEGSLAEGLFKDMKQLKNAWTVFAGCKKLYGKIPSDLFANNLQIADTSGFFNGCTGLVGTIPETIFSNSSGSDYTKLVKISSMFSGCTGLYGTEFPSNLLQYCPALLDVASLFNGCTGIEATIPNYFFQYNPLLQNVSYCFANTGANGTFPSNIFKGLTGLSNVAGFFSGCGNISGVLPDDLFADNPNLTTIDYLFQGCKGIQGTIPENLFYGLEEDNEERKFEIQSAIGVFSGCSTLSGYLPEKLLYKFTKVEDLSNFFAYCYQLRGNIPEGFLSKCEKLKKVAGMFNESNGIGNRNPNSNNPYCIPEDLFENNFLLEDCSNMFQSWGESTPLPTGVSHGLKGAIPPNLFDNNQKLLYVGSMFAGQGGITGELAGDLFRFTPNIENLSSFVGGCSGITKLGDGFLSNNKKVKNVYYMFYGCSNMVGEMTQIWTNTYCPLITGTDVSKFQDCFRGCTKLTNYYTEIPTQWGGGYSPTSN